MNDHKIPYGQAAEYKDKFHPQGVGMPPEPKRRSTMAKIVRGVVIVAIVIFLGASCTAVVVGSLATEAMNDSIVDPTYSEEPGIATPTLTMTVSQAQAIESAQQYVDFSGFSKRGLMRQLTSNAGSGFTEADAEFALKHIKVDYNAEAVEAAQSYLDLTSFSRKGLIDQLTSPASGFTLKQATYATNKVGL